MSNEKNQNSSNSMINGVNISSIITPKNDIVFKRIFGKRGNEEILKSFLESILDVKITDLTLDHNTEILPEIATGKLSRVDVLARLGDGTLVDIEIQSREKGFKEKRCLQYWSRLYSQDIEKGKDYLQLNKTICIWIVDSTVYEEFKEYESTWKVQETRYGVKGHFEDFEMHVIELQKFRNTDIIKPSKREFWLWFIDHTKKELVEMSVRDMKEVEKAYEEYKRITSDKGLMNAIINMDMAEMDRAQEITDAIAEGESRGEKRGKEKGKEESKIEIAKKLLNMNMTVEDIVEATGLTVEEVEKLKEEK